MNQRHIAVVGTGYWGKNLNFLASLITLTLMNGSLETE